jgi:glycosyltransferase involved in cell wall biosynthesis
MNAKRVLWWGKSDTAYSRNRQCRKLLNELGFEIVDFNPLISQCAHVEAIIRNIKKPDVVWVPCFRQRDILAARKWSSSQKVPLIVDPLISAWDKQVFERNKFPAESSKAKQLKQWESSLLNSADIVLVDTDMHASLFAHQLNVPRHKIFTLYVGAEQSLFQPMIKDSHQMEEVLFYGSFIGLHGIKTIIEAAKIFDSLPIKNGKTVIWTLLGNGPEKEVCQALASGYANIRFENAIQYADLPRRISQSDIVLGVFGGSAKAGNVIPNKVFQAMACGRPVITRESEAYPASLKDDNHGIFFIPAENPASLASMVANLLTDGEKLKIYGLNARHGFNQFFSDAHLKNQLTNALSAINLI